MTPTVTDYTLIVKLGLYIKMGHEDVKLVQDSEHRTLQYVIH